VKEIERNRFCVIQSYAIQYGNPITLQVGDAVILGEEEKDPKWKGWIWVENATHKGWIPIQILEISPDRKTGKVLGDYTAKEVDVEKGDTVTKIKTLNGWCWVKNERTNEEGWIPEEIIL
jgi:hypothetical protein